ncbi:MAG TPA: translation elongation factor Ts [Gemmatales bacterium]|nr:translation elongation factor Ts [Gemmatales bacterium]
MSTINAADVMKLRNMTDRPMMECKKVLTEAGGDFQKAMDELRKRNSNIAAGKADREAAEGRVFVAISPDHSKAAILELRCESAPVTKANEIAEWLLKADKLPASVDELNAAPFEGKHTIKDRIEELIGLIRENMKVARFAVLQNGPFGSYVHYDGTVGVLLQLQGDKANAKEEVLKEIAMHITACQTKYALRDHIPAEVLAKEKEIAEAQAKETGKPEKVLAMIVESKLKTWVSENVLLEQKFVKDNTKTIADILSPMKLNVVGFKRFKVGELS